MKRERIDLMPMLAGSALVEDYLEFLAYAVHNFNTNGGTVDYGIYLARALDEVYKYRLRPRFMEYYKKIARGNENERNRHFD